MSRHRLLFYGTKESETQDNFIECFSKEDQIIVWLEEEDRPPSHICLDVSTAIKFAKTIRTEINKVKGVTND